MDTPMPWQVVVMDESENEVTILDMFRMNDGTTLSITEMEDEQILAALTLASKTGRELEQQGYKVNY